MLPVRARALRRCGRLSTRIWGRSSTHGMMTRLSH